MVNNLKIRTLVFAKNIITFIKQCRWNSEDGVITKQLLRSATSIGANYREANEAETTKEFQHKIRIAKKEAKETVYRLSLIELSKEKELPELIDEATQIMKILGAIYHKVSSKKD